MLTTHEPAPASNHCNEEHVYVVNIIHVMMNVARSQCSHCILTDVDHIPVLANIALTDMPVIACGVNNQVHN